MIGRRSVLRLFGGAAVAGRGAAEATARDLSGLLGGIGGSSPGSSVLTSAVRDFPHSGQQGVGNLTKDASRKLLQSILNTPADRAELMGLLNKVHRNIYRIDPDIGGRRSWSLAAKLVYQRERNIEKDIDESLRDVSSWSELQSWWRDKVLRTFGLSL